MRVGIIKHSTLKELRSFDEEDYNTRPRTLYLHVVL